MNYVLYLAEPHYKLLCHFLTIGFRYIFSHTYVFRNNCATYLYRGVFLNMPVLKMQITQKQFPVLLPLKTRLKITQLPPSSDFHLD